MLPLQPCSGLGLGAHQAVTFVGSDRHERKPGNDDPFCDRRPNCYQSGLSDVLATAPVRGSRSFPQSPVSIAAFAGSRVKMYATRSTEGTARKMLRYLARSPGWVLAAILIWSPCMRGQESSDNSSESNYTEEQSDAIDRVDELVGRLQSMGWEPEVVNALSNLGAVACHYDQELGVRAFEAAYAAVSGFDLDLEDDAAEFDLELDRSMHILTQLAVTAPRCDPSFRDRPLTRQAATAELRARGSLDATWENLETDPDEAAKFAQVVANHAHNLPEDQQVMLARGLRKLRLQRPAEADELFQSALSSLASAGSIWDLFTLGNYILGPISGTEVEEALTTLPDGNSSAYLLSAVRPGVSSELVCQYVATAVEMLLTEGTPNALDAESFALAAQLASWAKTNAQEHSSTLESLLAAQADPVGIQERLSEYRKRIEHGTSSSNLEEELKSAIDETERSRLSFMLCMNLIEDGEFSQAEDLIGDLRPEFRRALRNFIQLEQAKETIGSCRLEEATAQVAGLKDSLHQVLGALSLASAYWSRSTDEANRPEEDRDSADRALRHATGSAENVPDHLRPHARIAIAAVMAKADRSEEAMQVLELALQELGPRESGEDTNEEKSGLLVTPHPWGGFSVEITDGYSAIVQDLHPPNLDDATFEGAVHRLSLSPEIELDRLDAIASRAIDARTRAEGLVAVAKGALTRAFGTRKAPPSTDKPAKSTKSSDEVTGRAID